MFNITYQTSKMFPLSQYIPAPCLGLPNEPSLKHNSKLRNDSCLLPQVTLPIESSLRTPLSFRPTRDESCLKALFLSKLQAQKSEIISKPVLQIESLFPFYHGFG